MKVFIKGLNSCAMRNQKLRQYHLFLTANGHEMVSDPTSSDAILMWTCGYRGDFRDNCLSEIQRHQQDYDSELIVAGCLPDIAPGLLRENFPGRVVKWRDDKKLEELFGRKVSLNQISPIFCQRKICEDASRYREENRDKDVTFYDQFIKLVVSEGCTFECTYCSEKLAFPPFHSFPEDKLVEACRQMVEKTGEYDVILLADNLGAYGSDSGSNLPKLIRQLRQIHPDLRVALNNLNPTYFIQYYNDIVGFIHEGAILHLNLPIQSASAPILRSMNRPYTRDDIDKIFSLLNSMGFTRFDTHLIIGFPGETEEDFEETVKFILRHRPSYVLLNGYMESPGVVASRFFNKVSEELKWRRLGDAEACIKEAGIICNTDNSELSAERFRRIKTGGSGYE